MVMPLPIPAVVASVVDAVATPAVPKRMATVPRLLVTLTNTEAAIDALTTRDARSMEKQLRDRLLMAARSRNAIIAKSTIRTHGSTSITTLRDPNTTTRSRLP